MWEYEVIRKSDNYVTTVIGYSYSSAMIDWGLDPDEFCVVSRNYID